LNDNALPCINFKGKYNIEIAIDETQRLPYQGYYENRNDRDRQIEGRTEVTELRHPDEISKHTQPYEYDISGNELPCAFILYNHLNEITYSNKKTGMANTNAKDEDKEAQQ
jgi:hypothetical protein